MPGVAFMPEADIADAFGLRDAGQISDRDPDQAVHGANIVELQSVNDQMVSVGQLGLSLVEGDGGVRWNTGIRRRRGSRNGHRQTFRLG